MQDLPVLLLWCFQEKVVQVYLKALSWRFIKVNLHFGLNPEKWLMPVLQNLYKSFFKWPPLTEKTRVIHKRLFVSLIDLTLVKTGKNEIYP